MRARVAGPDGTDRPVHMGSYGIGVSRLVAAIIASASALVFLFTADPDVDEASSTGERRPHGGVIATFALMNYLGYVLGKDGSIKGNVNFASNYLDLNQFMTSRSTRIARRPVAACRSSAGRFSERLSMTEIARYQVKSVARNAIPAPAATGR